MNIPTIWHYIYAAEHKVMLPPPLKDEEVNIRMRPEKENERLYQLLHDVDIYADQIPVENQEELLKQLEPAPQKRSEHTAKEDAPTHRPPKKASKEEVIRLCEQYYQLANY